MATKKSAAKTKSLAKKKTAARKPAASPEHRSAQAHRSPKAVFLETFQREHATTVKVLRALPPGQSEFRPHPRSQCARELAFTFVMEQNVISLALRDQFKLGAGAPKVPTDFSMILDQFEADFNSLVGLIKKSPDKAFDGAVDFPTGPGKVAAWPKLDFMWMMLHDQIHHRGQYAVYVRMAGGKVPSIYGPSADEPWF